MRKFLAHISDDGREQTLRDHLMGVAELAAKFAETFESQDMANYIGMLHDIGKYSEAFQKRLLGSNVKVDHSTAGAIEAYKKRLNFAAFTIAGHHCGLPNLGNKHDSLDSATLCARLKKKVEDYSEWSSDITEINVDYPNWLKFNSANQNLQNYMYASYTRMLYSCLVDADFIDTETFMNGTLKPRGKEESLDRLLDKVRSKAQEYLSCPGHNDVNTWRNIALSDCLEQGRFTVGSLFTLTVPTGGGKTFSSLAFALEHAIKHNKQRVIYVIPYTSIIDQTVAEYKNILGQDNVLADYSTVDYKLIDCDDLTYTQYKHLLASENWDAPVVVTTAVQFFESMYSNRSSKCRKLHNIANSVVIFDEAQTMPTNYLKPCVSAISQLINYYHTSVVLSTATQPYLKDFFCEFLLPEFEMREIISDTETMRNALRRVKLKNLNCNTKSSLCEELVKHDQFLCVVNTRKEAQDIYSNLPENSSFCLTTLLCPFDRKKQVDEIKMRLKNNEPCMVVSTSLIEAGVDVDFPVVYRELAGLDSIIQTAGRCNREGKRSGESVAYYFELEDGIINPLLTQNINAMNLVLNKYSDSIDSPEAIELYFKNLYHIKDKGLDIKGILDDEMKLNFAEVSNNFKIIEQNAKTIYIPIEEGAELCNELKNGNMNRTIMRRLGFYGVSCYDKDYELLRGSGAITVIDENISVLEDIDMYYDSKIGLWVNAVQNDGIFI